MKMSNPPQDAGGSNPLAPTSLKYLRRFSFERGRGGGFSPGAGLREQNRSKPSRNRSDDLGFAANGWIETARQGAEREPIDLRAQVVRNQMPVRLGREAGVGVAEDPLHRCHIGSAHEKERSRRVPEVVEPDRPNLSRGPELHLASRAAAKLVV